MADDSLSHHNSRAPQGAKHSHKRAFSGKSRLQSDDSTSVLGDPGTAPPIHVNGKVLPRRLPNKARRTREYLTSKEVEQLMVAARRARRHGYRNATLILIAYRHGLRVSELVSLRWDQIELNQGLLHVTRVKNGTPSTHPLRGPEIRALRRLQRDYDGPYVFMTERGGPLTTSAVWKMIVRAGHVAGISFPVHPHMLRHACGFKLANDGHDTRALQHYLGHKSIQHTTRYTELAADRFNTFWRD